MRYGELISPPTPENVDTQHFTTYDADDSYLTPTESCGNSAMPWLDDSASDPSTDSYMKAYFDGRNREVRYFEDGTTAVSLVPAKNEVTEKTSNTQAPAWFSSAQSVGASALGLGFSEGLDINALASEVSASGNLAEGMGLSQYGTPLAADDMRTLGNGALAVLRAQALRRYME